MTTKSIRVLNLHKAYNIRVGLLVESLVSNPSTQAKPREQEKKEREEKFQCQMASTVRLVRVRVEEGYLVH